MTDPTVLRARAGRCRAAATEIRRQAADLGRTVPALQQKYPIATIWKGPAADTFTTAVTSAQHAVAQASGEAQTYAAHLERTAVRLERDAVEEDRRRAAVPR